MCSFEPVLASMVNGRWHAGIGDPTFLGWFTAAAYIIGAFVCLRAALIIRRSDSGGSPSRGEFLYWFGFAVFLFALGINKQLDLQTLFTDLGKQFAQSTGWYAERRIVQAAFIAVISFIAIVVMAVGVLWTRHLPRACRCALAGGVFLAAFIIVRAASFHHVDQMLGVRIGGVRMNVILEVGGIACVTASACYRLASIGGDAPLTRPARPAAV